MGQKTKSNHKDDSIGHIERILITLDLANHD